MSLPLIPRPAFSEALPGCSFAPVSVVDSDEFGTEGYRLEVLPQKVTLAGGRAGQFYGQQTLRQLQREDGSWPCCRVVDRPRFGWRGLMLDVARHFFTPAEIKRFLDVMAAHKLNVFHWHLTDDQGWRLEIRRYPRLTEVGAWREGIGFGLDAGASRNYRADGRYGGFYTQAEVREIVAYAAQRCIRVVPEIEMPGHSTAALAAYPELSCRGQRRPIEGRAGIFDGVFCAGREETFAFLEGVLDEVVELFADRYVHVGGDEVPQDNWRDCARCRARRQAEGLRDEAELQSYFIRRVERSLESRGRRLIGWDEILEGGLAPHATVMSWRGVAGGVAAAAVGHDVVMTPSSHCYFDFPQGLVAQPKAATWAATISWEKVLEFEPVTEEIPAAQRGHVLGGQANVWTEWMPNYGHVEFMAYPRACALAEVLWSPREGRSVEEFRQRLRAHTRFLDRLGVLYARPVG